MTHDDIIRMAREAKLVIDGNNSGDDDLLAFANLVAAAEREECAKVCEAGVNSDKYPSLTDCAAAIRARGEQS